MTTTNVSPEEAAEIIGLADEGKTPEQIGALLVVARRGVQDYFAKRDPEDWAGTNAPVQWGQETALVRRVLATRRKPVKGADDVRAVIEVAKTIMLRRVPAADQHFVVALFAKMNRVGMLAVTMQTRDWEQIRISRQGGHKALMRVVSRSGGILRATKNPGVAGNAGREIAAKVVARLGPERSPWFFAVNRRALPREVIQPKEVTQVSYEIETAQALVLQRVKASDQHLAAALFTKMVRAETLAVTFTGEDWAGLGLTRQGGHKALMRVVGQSDGILRATKDADQWRYAISQEGR